MAKVLNIENATLMYTNFSARPDDYHPEGYRSFCVVLDEDTAADLKEEGWNVKYTNPKDPEVAPVPYIQVAVRFDRIPPTILQVSSEGKVYLDENTVGELDWADISTVDVVISGSSWSVRGASGIKAYLKKMYVTLEDDPFAAKYRDIPTGDEVVDDYDTPF